jgi:NitT/TauT family transport system substrate-binding protein
MNRRFASLIILTALALGAPATAQAPTKLVVSWGTLEPTNTPVWIANESGIFKKHGLDVDLHFVGSSLQLTALIGGEIQISMVGGGEVVGANASGADLVILGTLGPVSTYMFEVPASIKTVADMKGKSVAVSRFGDAADIQTRIAFRKLGLDPKDVTFIQVGTSSSRFTALLNGAVQGTVASPGLNVPLEQHGMHQLFDMAKMKIPAANITIVGRRDWIYANRATAQRYVDAILEAIHRMQTDRAYSIAVLKQYFKTDDTKAMSDSYDYITRVIPAVPYPKAEQFTSLIAEGAYTNEKLKSVNVAKMLDDSFMRDAAKRMNLR